MSEQQSWEMISTERLRLADELEALTPEQWATRSQCEHWTVQEVAAHLVMPFEISTPAFVLAMARSRFDFDRAIRRLTARVYENSSTAEIIEKLRANHDNRWTPPKSGPEAPLGEIVVHGQDIRRVLGMEHTTPQATVDHALSVTKDPDVRTEYRRRVGDTARS